MSLAPKNVKCIVKRDNSTHYFDLRTPKDLVFCKCRCGIKSSGFPDGNTNTTRVVNYKTTHQILERCKTV